MHHIAIAALLTSTAFTTNGHSPRQLFTHNINNRILYKYCTYPYPHIQTKRNRPLAARHPHYQHHNIILKRHLIAHSVPQRTALTAETVAPRPRNQTSPSLPLFTTTPTPQITQRTLRSCKRSRQSEASKILITMA